MAVTTILLTGASDGIGEQAARKLAADAHRLLLVGRSPEKIEHISTELGTDFFVANQAKLDDVRALAIAVRERLDGLDVLVNDAGAVFDPRTLTEDGHEQTLQVNHLAPVLLTSMLMDNLLEAGGAVVNTSSIGARWRKIRPEDLEHEENCSSLRAYNDAKLGIVVFTRSLHDRFHSRGRSSGAFHPGAISTNFGSQSNLRTRVLCHTPLRHLFTSAEKGGANLTWFVEGRRAAPGRLARSTTNDLRSRTVIPTVDDVNLADALGRAVPRSWAFPPDGTSGPRRPRGRWLRARPLNARDSVRIETRPCPAAADSSADRQRSDSTPGRVHVVQQRPV